MSETLREGLTDDEVNDIDDWMDRHMAGHRRSNSVLGWTCSGDCRRAAIKTAVDRVLVARRALLAATASTPDEVGLVGDGWEHAGPDPMITGGLADDVEVLAIEDDR